MLHVDRNSGEWSSSRYSPFAFATPELRETGNGAHVTTVRVATNDREQAEFHDVVLWRQLADFAATYMTKGRLVYVEVGSRAAPGRE